MLVFHARAALHGRSRSSYSRTEPKVPIMRPHHPRPWLFAAALLLVSSGVEQRAQAQASVNAQVIVVLASQQAGTIDASLATLPALRQPPFSAFKSMKVLSRPGVVLKAGQPATRRLPNGRRLQLELLQRMPDGRYKVRVSINRPNQKDYLRLLEVMASPGEPFFVAGQKYQGGMLVIGVRVGSRGGR